MFLVNVMSDRSQAFLEACASKCGLFAFSHIETPSYALVLPSKKALCEELGSISQCYSRRQERHTQSQIEDCSLSEWLGIAVPVPQGGWDCSPTVPPSPSKCQGLQSQSQPGPCKSQGLQSQSRTASKESSPSPDNEHLR